MGFFEAGIRAFRRVMCVLASDMKHSDRTCAAEESAGLLIVMRAKKSLENGNMCHCAGRKVVLGV